MTQGVVVCVCVCVQCTCGTRALTGCMASFGCHDMCVCVCVCVCHTQAGLLEKALEITAWLLRTGIKWDEDTFTELISTVEIAQLWDSKVRMLTKT